MLGNYTKYDLFRVFVVGNKKNLRCVVSIDDKRRMRTFVSEYILKKEFDGFDTIVNFNYKFIGRSNFLEKKIFFCKIKRNYNKKEKKDE